MIYIVDQSKAGKRLKSAVCVCVCVCVCVILNRVFGEDYTD